MIDPDYDLRLNRAADVEGLVSFGQNKKAEHCPAFSPNLTMNLTYLCYGPPNIY